MIVEVIYSDNHNQFFEIPAFNSDYVTWKVENNLIILVFKQNTMTIGTYYYERFIVDSENYEKGIVPTMLSIVDYLEVLDNELNTAYADGYDDGYNDAMLGR